MTPAAGQRKRQLSHVFKKSRSALALRLLSATALMTVEPNPLLHGGETGGRCYSYARLFSSNKNFLL